MDELLKAIREINSLHQQKVNAAIARDPDFARFDRLLHLARKKKEAAKYAWIAHVESHGCGSPSEDGGDAPAEKA